jgi:hypothetical protein
VLLLLLLLLPLPLLLLLLLQDGNDSGVINIPAVSNCLSLLMRDAGLMKFVKYVSAAAPGSRWVVIGVDVCWVNG